MPTVAITDYTFSDLSLEEAVLRPAGIEIVSFTEKRSPAELAELVRNADAVIAQFAPKIWKLALLPKYFLSCDQTKSEH